MRVSFAAHADDAVAMTALRYLSGARENYPTQMLTGTEPASASTICLFSVEGLLRNRFLRLPGHRTEENISVPVWCRSVPFRVAISAPNARANPAGLRIALSNMAADYRRWGPWMRSPDAPWNPEWSDGVKHPAFELWRAQARAALNGVPTFEKLMHRVQPVFETNALDISRLVITGCALFNRPHTDVVNVIPKDKQRVVVETLASVVHDAGVDDVQFVVPRADLVRSELRDHFHPFMFMSVADAERSLGHSLRYARIFGERHARARSDAQVAEALECSGDALVRDIVAPLQEECGIPVRAITWSDYIGPYLAEACMLAERYRSEAEAIYMARVSTRPSYASLHKLDPVRGLRRTIANNAFYLAEARYLERHAHTAVINCEFEDAFWRGLEPAIEREIWGSFRPLIGMVPLPARQPWGY